MTKIGIILGSTRSNRNGRKSPSGFWIRHRGVATPSST